MGALGWCVMLRRTVFDQLMGLDENLESHAANLDLCLRVDVMNLDVMIDRQVKMTRASATGRKERTLSYNAFQAAPKYVRDAAKNASSGQSLDLGIPLTTRCLTHLPPLNDR